MRPNHSISTNPESVRFTAPISDPPMTRGRGLHRHPGSLLLALAAVIYTAMLFGYLPADMLDRACSILQNQRSFVIGHGGFAIQTLVVLMALFLLYTVTVPFVRHASRDRRR